MAFSIVAGYLLHLSPSCCESVLPQCSTLCLLAILNLFLFLIVCLKGMVCCSTRHAPIHSDQHHACLTPSTMPLQSIFVEEHKSNCQCDTTTPTAMYTVIFAHNNSPNVNCNLQDFAELLATLKPSLGMLIGFVQKKGALVLLHEDWVFSFLRTSQVPHCCITPPPPLHFHSSLCSVCILLPVLVIAHQWCSSLGMLVATIPLSWCCSSCHGHLLALHTHACTHRRRKWWR